MAAVTRCSKRSTDRPLDRWPEIGDRVDVLVTDVIMPRLGGRELVDRLLAHRPDLPVIFLSGYTASAFEGAELDPHRVRYLPKPVPRDELVNTVSELVEQGSAGRNGLLVAPANQVA